MKKLSNLLSGFSQNMAFSNWHSLIFQRIFLRRERYVSYLWKNRWWVTCDQTYLDSNSPKEVLSLGVYNEAIVVAARNGEISYVNIGGNIGTFDIAVASLVENVLSGITFELNPNTAARLHFNLKANNLNKIEVKVIGIGGQNGTYYLSENGCAHSFGIRNISTSESAIECRVQTLSEALSAEINSGNEWDLLKMDCEGAEYEILRKTKIDVLQKFRFIVLEIHEPSDGYSRDDIELWFRNAGFIKEPMSIPDSTNIELWRRNH